MRPSLPADTLLQNRYRILNVLGQGGFGRTYLAEDQRRFNELCAIKELIPAQGDSYSINKSRELFLREAEILHRIQHPQIPQFREHFEQDQRLYLVQDYVEGTTYRAMLDQRRVQGYAFSEAEVLQVLTQLLPVLAHLHSKNIIHRDISPDNIILRERDRLPVLIDFGVVKAVATQFYTPAGAPPQTTVGKLGYAPSEQMVAGNAYPSSDLYALAVTAVVLLTGREPQELYDDTTLTWYWQRWVTASPAFAEVLNRMLNHRPGDRFQSAPEVLQALQTRGLAFGGQGMPQMPPPGSFPMGAGASGSPPTVASQAGSASAGSPEMSQVRTVAVGGRGNVPVGSGGNAAPLEPRRGAPMERSRSSLFDDPWAVLLVGSALAVIAGIGSWALVRTLQSVPSPEPTISVTESAPSPTPSISQSPSPSPSATPVNISRRVNVAADGSPIKESGSLKANETVTYVVPGKQDQQLIASLNGEGVLMTVLGPTKQPISEQSKRQRYWQGTLDFDGDYFIQLSPVKGLDQGDYQLELSLKNPPKPTPTPTPTPTETPTPTPTGTPTPTPTSTGTPTPDDLPSTNPTAVPSASPGNGTP